MRQAVYGLAGLVLVALLGFFVLAWRGEIAVQIDLPPELAAPDPEQISKGERLALLGNCAGCHTTPGGEKLAGGLAIDTPFGAIYSTNITPDRETGIGDWSLEAYVRSMREGVDREGNHLYPAFPYEYFARITDTDLADLYVWNMVQPAIAATPPPNDLIFGANFRPLLAGWKVLFHSDKRFTPSPGRSQEWNAGAYLAEGLGHCAACHTPRNSLGGAMESQADQGGEAYDWWAPPLTAANPTPQIWTEAALQSYLRTGRSPAHGVAAGPMADVVHGSLAKVPESDTGALAHYLADQMARAPSTQVAPSHRYGIARAELSLDRAAMGTSVFDDGARLFTANCSTCHHDSGPSSNAFPRLSDGSAVAGPDPRNLVQVILWGIGGEDAGSGQAYMPRFYEELTDVQIAAIVEHLRNDSINADLVARLRDGGPVRGAGGGPVSGFASTTAGILSTDPGATP